MSIYTPLHQFVDDEIEKAPTLWGVYALHDSSATIYIGKGEGVEGIRGRLNSHKGGHEGSCTQNTTLFNYETCSNPSQRESQLLQEYKRLWGKLPRCNDVTPS